MPIIFPGITSAQRQQQQEEAQKKAAAAQLAAQQAAAQRAVAQRAAQQKQATATVIARHAIPPATIVRSQPVQQAPQYSRSQSNAQRFLDIFTGGSGTAPGVTAAAQLAAQKAAAQAAAQRAAQLAAQKAAAQAAAQRAAQLAAQKAAAKSTAAQSAATELAAAQNIIPVSQVKATTTKAASTYKNPRGAAIGNTTTQKLLVSGYNAAETGGQGLALLGGGVYKEALDVSQGKGVEPLQTASKQWLSMKGSKQNMVTAGKVYVNLIPVLGGAGHLAKHPTESTGAKLVDVGEVALSVLPFADTGLGTGLSLTKMAVTGGAINVGVGETISKLTTGKLLGFGSLKTNAVEGGLMGVAGGLGGMGLGAGLAKAGLGSGLAAKALGGAAVNTALTLPFSRNPTQLMESAAFGAAMGVAPDLITATHANLDEALGTGTIAKEAGTTLGKEGPATVYETQSELADIGKVRIIGDVTENPASAEELANEYVGRTVTSTHMTPSDEIAAFGAKSGSKLLLKGMNEGVSGSRASSDLLNFYKAPANLEGEATTYGGYAGIGKGEEYSLSLKGSGKASMLVFSDEHIADFGIKPGESPEDYIARINTEGAGKTGIAQENYLGRSTERQLITPTKFEGKYGDYPGTTIESEGKIGKVWVKTGFLQYKGMDVYGAHTLGAGDLTGDLSKGNDLLGGKGNDLLGGKGLDLEKYNTDLLSSAGRHIVSPSIGNSIGSSFGSFGSRLQFGSGIKSTRTKSIGWSSAGSFGIGSRLGDMTNLSRFGRSKGIKSSGTGSSGGSKKPIGSSGKKSPGRPPSTSKGSSSHGRGTSVWSPPTGYEHGTSVWSKGSSSYIHHGITTLSIGSSGKKSSGYKRPSYTGSSITYAPPTKKRAVVVPLLYTGFGPKARLAKGKSSKRYFETKFELPDIAKSVTGHSFRNAKKWRDLL